MHIHKLQLTHFRNHAHTSIDWASGINVITGSNGAGKTSLIDAIHYLCMSKSFVSGSDQYVAAHDESFFMVKGFFEGNIRSKFVVDCNYSKKEGKKFFINGSPVTRFSDLIGVVPVVVLAPEDKKLTREGPAERRSFLDGFISQLSSGYLKLLIDYRHIVKQRNRILQELRDNSTLLFDYLEPWSEQLIKKGAAIIRHRHLVLEQFKSFLEEDYAFLSGMQLRASLRYKTFCSSLESEEQIEGEYRLELERNRENERNRELTLIGPHRDDILFTLDGSDLRKFGSQGQHRVFALSLKLSQLHYYKQELDDLPILLLDDVFGDLDPQKTNMLLNALHEHQGQTFITSANRKLFDTFIDFEEGDNRLYSVENGIVTSMT